MDKMPQNIAAVIRHALTFGGGYVVAAGWMNSAGLEGAVGGVMTLLGVAWSIYQKVSAPKE